MDIHIQTSGLEHVKRLLNVQAEKLEDLTEYWDSVGKYMEKKTIQERFEKEQAPDGTKWQPLSPARVKQRLKKHKKGDFKILKDEGYLRRIHYEAGKDYMQIGTNVKYAKVHQYGAKITYKHEGEYKHDNPKKSKKKGDSYYYECEVEIPARPFLGVNEYELRHIKGMLTSYVKRHILGGG